ncbi:MAG: WD repeat and HMG-box DNA binding-domain containing protein 1 [Marteilia pararefringens]
MPNSTSFRKETQSKIFLDYNSVGTIELTRILQQKSDDEYFDDSEIKKREESTIVVKFHDSTFHQTVYLKNSNNYSIGRLSKSILVLIGNDEEEVKIYAQLFDTWTSLRVWNHSIPSNNGENRVKCFCISQDHIFIATQQNDVHILNFSGHQIDIFSCRAPILSIVASAIQKNEKNLLCVVYEDMNCDVFEYSNWEMRMSYETSLPISSALLWVSFCSSYGILSCSDVQGPVKIFNPDTRVWYPIYGFKDQKIWPININVGKNAIYGIPLENKISAEPIVDQLNVVKKFAFNSYSMLNNNPNIMPKELQEAWTAKIVKSAITSCKGSGEKSMEKSILANLVRAFDALAVANEHQAFEIVKLMPNDNAKKICMKYAQKKGNNALSDQIADYLSSRLTNPDHFDN